MNDRELLVLAAKAAGVEGEYTDNIYAGGIGIEQKAITKNTSEIYCETYKDQYKNSTTIIIQKSWNPLTDDGDALRLAIKIGAVIGTYANYSTVDLLYPNYRIEGVEIWHSSENNDPYASTRRAIVRAAAEIGKQK